MNKVLGLGLPCVLAGCVALHDSTGGGRRAISKYENGETASRGYVITNPVSNAPIKVGEWVYFFEDGKKVPVSHSVTVAVWTRGIISIRYRASHRG